MVLNIGQHCSLRKSINAKIDHKAIVFLSKWLWKPFQYFSNSRLSSVKNDCAMNNKSVSSSNRQWIRPSTSVASSWVIWTSIKYRFSLYDQKHKFSFTDPKNIYRSITRNQKTRTYGTIKSFSACSINVIAEV